MNTNIMNLFSLEGKNAIVTGANTGLGQGICVALAGAGAKVFGVARRSCEETKTKIEEAGGCFEEIIVDLSLSNAVDLIMEKVNEKTNRIDILVNNAGIISRKDAIDVTLEDWENVNNLNEKLVFFLSQAIAKTWINQNNNEGGKIINIASMLSYQGGIRVPSYTTSKSGVLGMTRALANEWAKYNINVNAIAPGYMATNNTTQIRNDSDRNEAILDRIPAGRWGTAEDMYGAAIFLASNASNYMNGFTVAVDGGWLSR